MRTTKTDNTLSVLLSAYTMESYYRYIILSLSPSLFTCRSGTDEWRPRMAYGTRLCTRICYIFSIPLHIISYSIIGTMMVMMMTMFSLCHAMLDRIPICYGVLAECCWLPKSQSNAAACRSAHTQTINPSTSPALHCVLSWNRSVLSLYIIVEFYIIIAWFMEFNAAMDR